MRQGLDARRLAQVLLGLAAAVAVFGVLGRWRDALGLPAGRDLLVERLPSFGASFLLSWGFLACNAAALAYAWLYERRRVPFFLATLGLFVAVRSVFIFFCPYGPLPDMQRIYTGGLGWLNGVNTFDSELFFSGHTALPYLYALLFAKPAVSRAFLAVSAAMAAGVLVTRNHYTIDVLGAYFITFSIRELARRAFVRLEAA